MRIAFTSVLLCLSISLPAQKQDHPARYIAFIDGREPINAAFFQSRLPMTEVIFEAARDGKVRLFRFDDFDQPPKSIPYPALAPLMVYPHETWRKDKSYKGREIVQYEGRFFSSEKPSANTVPGTNDAWVVAEPWQLQFGDLTLIGLDYQSEGTSAGLRYLHFYFRERDVKHYVISVRADEAIASLNAKKVIWSPSLSRPMNRWADHLFLLSQDDREKLIGDLQQNAAAGTLSEEVQKISKHDAYDIGILTGYKMQRVEKFLLYRATASPQVLDSLTPTAIPNPPPDTKFMLMGDALIAPGTFKVSAEHKRTIQIPFKNSPATVAGDPKPQKNVTIDVIERLTFDHPFYARRYPNEAIENLRALAGIVRDAVINGHLKVYDPRNPDSIYSRASVIERWLYPRADNEYEEWKRATDYYIGDIVSWNDTLYKAGIDNVSKSPAANPAAWEKMKPVRETYQSADVGFYDVHYKVTINSSAQVVSKRAVFVQPGVPGGRTISGIDKPFGYVRYDELLNYLQTGKAVLLPIMKNIFGQQNGLFEMMDYGVFLSE